MRRRTAATAALFPLFLVLLFPIPLFRRRGGLGDDDRAENDGREAGLGRNLTCASGLGAGHWLLLFSLLLLLTATMVVGSRIACGYAEAVVFAFEGGDADVFVALNLLSADGLHSKKSGRV